MNSMQFGALVDSIMISAERDGEPVTREEAIEMARMEIGATEVMPREKQDKPKRKYNRTVKKDAEKVAIIKGVAEWLADNGYTDVSIKNDVKEITFNGCFSLTLIKHRPPKPKAED